MSRDVTGAAPSRSTVSVCFPWRRRRHTAPHPHFFPWLCATGYLEVPVFLLRRKNWTLGAMRTRGRQERPQFAALPTVGCTICDEHTRPSATKRSCNSHAHASILRQTAGHGQTLAFICAARRIPPSRHGSIKVLARRTRKAARGITVENTSSFLADS